jgi:F-box and leucine-rich repeat protein 2/20
MRGADLINPALPDELLDDVIRRVGAGPGGGKRDLDACALVCRRWRRLERASRRSARLAASGERADEVLRLVAERFPALADVSVDERLTAAGVVGAVPRSRRPRQARPVSPSPLLPPVETPGSWLPLVLPRAGREKCCVFQAMI